MRCQVLMSEIRVTNDPFGYRICKIYQVGILHKSSENQVSQNSCWNIPTQGDNPSSRATATARCGICVHSITQQDISNEIEEEWEDAPMALTAVICQTFKPS